MIRTIPDLIPGTMYAIQVRADDGVEKSEWSQIFYVITATDGRKPDVPTNVSWGPVGNSFHGEWDTITTSEDGSEVHLSRYEVELTAGAVVKTLAVPVQTEGRPTYTLSFEANMALFGSAQSIITMRVRGVNVNGLGGEWSSPITASIEAPDPPLPPLTGEIIEPGLDSMQVSWRAPEDSTGVVGYAVYVSTNPEFAPSTSNNIFRGSATSTTMQTTTYDIHYFQITAFNAFGFESEPLEGSGSPINPYLVDVDPPGVPTGLSATLTNNTTGQGSSAQVSWSEPSDEDFRGVEVSYKRAADSFWSNKSFGKGTTTAVIELAYAFADYEFRIRSFDNSLNYSDWSSTVTANAETNNPPANVTGLTATAGKDSIIYRWNPVPDVDLKNYEVTFSTSSTFASGNIQFLTGTSATLSIGGLSPGQTYYARVRAVDSGGLTSAQWSATNTSTTGTFPSGDGDGVGPASSPTPSVTGGMGYLSAVWSPITTNSNGDPQTDPVAYEVHLSTTSGFTPSASTLASEVTGTFAMIDVLPGTSTPLAYDTTYYIKLIAKDADAAASPGAQDSAMVERIDAGLIETGTTIQSNLGITGTLTVSSTGVIQSSNYASNAGWKIGASGIEINSDGSSVKADAIKAGTLGGASGSGIINIAAGTSLVLNGGHLKSNTYNGTGGATSYDPAATAGFYLGDDGLRIANGAVSAATLTTGPITGATLTMGANGFIQTTGYTGAVGSGGFRLSSTGLEIPDGSLVASKLEITNQFATDVQNATTVIDGSKITTGTIQSNQSVTVHGQSTRLWSINTEGYASFVGVQIRGNAVVGLPGSSSSGSSISSGNFMQGSQGWTIRSDGSAEFHSATVRGSITVGMNDVSGLNTALAGKETAGAANNVKNGLATAGYTTINGGNITTGTISSNQFVTVNGQSVRAWEINTAGDAKFRNIIVEGPNATITGSTVRTSSATARIEMNTTGFFAQNASGYRNIDVDTDKVMVGGGNSVYTGKVVLDGNGKTEPGYSSSGPLVRLLSSWNGGMYPSWYGESRGRWGTDLWVKNNGEFVIEVDDGLVGTNAMYVFNKNGIATFDRLVITNTTNATNTSGNVPPLVIGDVGGNHLRLDGNEFISMNSQSVQGPLFLNGGGDTRCYNFQVNNALTVSTATVDMPNLLTGQYGGTGSPPITWNTNNGRLRVNTSSRRFKENIRDADINTDVVLALTPKAYERNDDQPEDLVDGKSPTRIGFVAEDAHDLGLTHFVHYDKHGEPFSFAYDAYTVAHQAVLREQAEQIKELTTRLEKLERRNKNA